MEHVKTNDVVTFSQNFYHPSSGDSIAADTTPVWYVYPNSSGTSVLDGVMVARTDIIGSYYGMFHASGYLGFDAGSFYDVQVSGAVEGRNGFNSVKQFVLDDIYDVNVVQVSGEVTSINDFKSDVSSLNDPTAAAIADAVWNEAIADHDTPGGAGHALVTASGNLIAGTWSTHGDPDLSNLDTTVSSRMATTHIDATAGVVDQVTLVDTTTTNTDMRGTDNAALNANLMSASGSITDSIDSLNDPTAAVIADAVWNEDIADHDTPGQTGHALVTASGNLIGGDWSTHAAADIWSVGTRELSGTISDFDGLDTALDSAHGAGNWITATGFATVGEPLTSTEVTQAVWNAVMSDYDSAGSTGQALVTASGNLIGAGSVLTEAGIADAVWDETLSDHDTPGGTGHALVTASGNLISGGWLPEASGNILSTHLNTIDTNVDILLAGVNVTEINSAPVNLSTEDDIADAVWDEAIADHDTPGGTGHALVTASGNLISGDWSTHGDPDLSALATNDNLMTVSGSLADSINTVNPDIYFANIKHIRDNVNAQDEYGVQWFKNDQPVSSGDLTDPRISVYGTATGDTVIDNTSMFYSSPVLGVVRYNEASSLIASGEPYLIETSGTIDSSMRAWRTIVGIDAL